MQAQQGIVYVFVPGALSVHRTAEATAVANFFWAIPSGRQL